MNKEGVGNGDGSLKHVGSLDAGSMEWLREMLRGIAEARSVALPPDTASLIHAGVLDSFGMLEFLTTIEDELNIKIPDEDLLPSNFDSIAKIGTYVEGRLGR